MKDVIYLDHAAATPIDPKVLGAMLPYLQGNYFNPSAQYLGARSVKKDIDSARATVAHWLGSRPSEVIFTAGGTEANNIAIHGVLQRYPGANIVTSTVEHDAVLRPAAHYTHKLAPVHYDGRLDLNALVAAIDEQTVLVSIIYANNEIGTVQPLVRVSKIVAQVRAERQKSGNTLPLLLHTDACQAASYLDLHAPRLGVDMMTINASKMYGPKQAGALYVKGGIVLAPHIDGGGQEQGLRSGTQNVAGIIGLATALDLVQKDRHQESARIQALRTMMLNTLSNIGNEIRVNGSIKFRLPNNVHLTFPGFDNERLMMALDEAGIMVAAGSACSASSDEPSHVLKAIGMSDTDARSSLRFSMGRSTSADQIKRVLQTLQKLLAIPHKS